MNFVNCKRLHLLVNYISWERKIEIPFYHPLNTDSYSSCSWFSTEQNTLWCPKNYHSNTDVFCYYYNNACLTKELGIFFL